MGKSKVMYENDYVVFSHEIYDKNAKIYEERVVENVDTYTSMRITIPGTSPIETPDIIPHISIVRSKATVGEVPLYWLDGRINGRVLLSTPLETEEAINNRLSIVINDTIEWLQI